MKQITTTLPKKDHFATQKNIHIGVRFEIKVLVT